MRSASHSLAVPAFSAKQNFELCVNKELGNMQQNWETAKLGNSKTEKQQNFGARAISVLLAPKRWSLMHGGRKTLTRSDTRATVQKKKQSLRTMQSPRLLLTPVHSPPAWARRAQRLVSAARPRRSGRHKSTRNNEKQQLHQPALVQIICMQSMETHDSHETTPALSKLLAALGRSAPNCIEFLILNPPAQRNPAQHMTCKF